MKDIVFSAESYDALLNEARRIGFVEKGENGEDRIITKGALPNGGAYFLNYVGNVYLTQENPDDPENPIVTKVDGVWGRLRLNGDESAMPTFDQSITQYVYADDLGGWTNDGHTLAPAFVGEVGMIA